jgi:hypothetical protein
MGRLMMVSAIAIALGGCAQHSYEAPPVGGVVPTPSQPLPPPPEPSPPIAEPSPPLAMGMLPPPIIGSAPVAGADVPPPRRGPASRSAARPSAANASSRAAPQPSSVGMSPAYVAAAPAPAVASQGGCAPGDLDCNDAVLGRGSFAKPPEMWVGQLADLKFAVGKTDAAVARELLPDDRPAEIQDVNIGRCMRVTLEQNNHFDIKSPNGEVKRLSRDMGRASWRWSVLPTRPGTVEVRVKVEVLKRVGDSCTKDQFDEYTEHVSVAVQIGWWQKLLAGLGEARGVGDVFAALFKSWETALIALAALITALGGVVAAVRGLGSKGRERRAVRRDKRATKKTERAARPPRRKAAR